MDFSAVDRLIAEVEQTRREPRKVSPTEPLKVGVDLGTAYIVIVVTDAADKPVACAMRYAEVVRDGLVVDYVGAMQIVRELTEELEGKLGRKLERAAIAVPPGVGDRNSATHRHIVEAAGYSVTGILDEPTAANSVLQVRDGAIVDIGGGTTGIAVFDNGQVSYVADEPTGGTHVSLVLSGNYNISFAEAEDLKKEPARQQEILPIVRPVIEKMGAIIKRHIQEHRVQSIYLVGGTCCLPGIETVIGQYCNVPAVKPANPFLVTPLGIALNCGL